MTKPRTLVLAAVVVAVALPLSACGKKGSPNFPADSDYPNQYPPEVSPAAETQKSKTGPGNEYKGGAVSPQGFPLEYPNRPSY